jgi:hypothetical protein
VTATVTIRRLDTPHHTAYRSDEVLRPFPVGVSAATGRRYMGDQ